MQHIVYKTVNLVTEEFYVGKHSTENIDDGYLGSGLRLKHAIRKYGKGNFKRYIIAYCDTAKDASIAEEEIVNENLLADPLCYNLSLGGQGGNLGSSVNAKIGKKMSVILTGRPKTTEHKQAIKKAWANKNYSVSNVVRDKIKATITETWNNMSSAERKAKCGHPKETNGFYGKQHKESSIKQMKANLPNRTGSANSNAKPITMNGVTYNSRIECMKALHLSKRKFYKITGESL